MTKLSFTIPLFLVLAGCAVGPNYKRPQVAIPGEFRGGETPSATPAASLADTKWQELFKSEPLNQLIGTALDRNFDLRIAAERVQQARAQLGITRANQFPFMDVQGQFNAQRQSSIGSFRSSRRHQLERKLHTSRSCAFLGNRSLGTSSPPDRGRAGAISRQRRRTPRSHRVADRRRDDHIFPDARARTGIGHQPQNQRHCR